jgi:hypothetical protein
MTITAFIIDPRSKLLLKRSNLNFSGILRFEHNFETWKQGVRWTIQGKYIVNNARGAV